MSVWKIPLDLQWEKCWDHSSAFNFEWIFFILADHKENSKVWMSLNFIKISPIVELAPLANLQKLMDNVVTTLAPSFLIRSSSFFQVTRKTIKTWMSLNSKYNQPQTVELTALKCRKNLNIFTIGDLL